jgi:hypothetical protein
VVGTLRLCYDAVIAVALMAVVELDRCRHYRRYLAKLSRRDHRLRAHLRNHILAPLEQVAHVGASARMTLRRLEGIGPQPRRTYINLA